LAVLAQRTKRSQQFVSAIADAVPPTGETGLPAATELDLAERAATLYEQVVAPSPEPRKTELLSEIALVAEEITGDKAKATTFYERILELTPRHEHSLRALDSLYAAQERWPAPAKLLERRIVQATSADALVFRLRLGALRFARLGEPAQ